MRSLSEPTGGRGALDDWSLPAWTLAAACVGMDVALFFPTTQSSDAGAALMTCHHCPVIAECLASAIEHREYGIWGGLSGQARGRIGGRPR